MKIINGRNNVFLALVILPLFLGQPTAIAWEPTKPVEFVIPAAPIKWRD